MKSTVQSEEAVTKKTSHDRIYIGIGIMIVMVRGAEKKIRAHAYALFDKE
jgi:hypothetical protein